MSDGEGVPAVGETLRGGRKMSLRAVMIAALKAICGEESFCK